LMDDSEAQFSLTRFSQLLWDQLREELPDIVEFDRCGTVWVAADDEEMAGLSRKHTYYGERGVHTEILDSANLREAEPNLRSSLAGGLLVESDSVVYPPAAAAFFLEKAVALGATVHIGRAISSFRRGSARLVDGTTMSAGKLVNAAGQQAPKLTPGIQVKPRKGHLVITDRYPGVVRHQLVELGYLKSAHSVTRDSVAFNIQPRKTGQLLIGSSRQYNVEHDRAEPAIVSQMLKRAFEYVPLLSSLSAIRVWTGFRPATPDKLPLVGPWSEDPSLYLATGHEGLGVTTSLGTAKLICAQVCGCEPPIPREPYLPSRQMIAENHG
jgi:glycine/D-amino acid oxidase-like deaminating enzyme